MAQYCQLLPPILSVIRKMYCSCFARNMGFLTSTPIPYNYPQLNKMLTNLGWINDAMREVGSISEGNEVIEARLEPFGPSAGFYSELAKLTLKYKDPADPMDPPTDAIVKFLPVGFEKRLILDLVELPKSEVLCYYYLLRDHEANCIPPLPCPTPKLIYADFCSKTNNALCIMERIKHKLGDQRQPDDLNQQRALMLCLADVHSYFWGGASGRHPKAKLLNDPANPICLIAGLKMKLNIKAMLRLLKKENGYKPNANLAKALGKLIPEHMLTLLKWCVDHPMSTVCHGDARIDNVYFVENAAESGVEAPAEMYTAGLFDWAQAMNAPCFYDCSWTLANMSKEFFKLHHDNLLNLYWTRLQENLKREYGEETATKANHEEFLVGYAMAHAVGISKATIAFESIMKDKKAADYPHKLRLCMDGLENSLFAMHNLEALDPLRKLAKGESPLSSAVVQAKKRMKSVGAIDTSILNIGGGGGAKVAPIN